VSRRAADCFAFGLVRGRSRQSCFPSLPPLPTPVLPWMMTSPIVLPARNIRRVVNLDRYSVSFIAVLITWRGVRAARIQIFQRVRFRLHRKLVQRFEFSCRTPALANQIFLKSVAAIRAHINCCWRPAPIILPFRFPAATLGDTIFPEEAIQRIRRSRHDSAFFAAI